MSKRQPIPKSLKSLVWDTYIGELHGIAKCMVCNNIDIRQDTFHAGHVIAVANGGTTTVENLRPICSSCNGSMRTQHLEEFKQTYFTKPEPTKPRQKYELGDQVFAWLSSDDFGSIYVSPGTIVDILPGNLYKLELLPGHDIHHNKYYHILESDIRNKFGDGFVSNFQ